jgi:hypothetical protein
MKALPESLRGIFWDTDFESLDPEKHDIFVIERLLEKTTVEGFRWLLRNYSPELLQEVVSSSRRLKARDRNFWRLYLHAS